jgi:hypothetical protein
MRSARGEFIRESFEHIHAPAAAFLERGKKKTSGSTIAASTATVSLKLTCRDYPTTSSDDLTETMTAALLDGLIPEA